MAPVYDFRHVELDKIGRGKRIVKPPGGECSNIFSEDRTDHVTPRKTKNYMQSSIFSPDSPQNGHSSSPNTPSKMLDTQNRLFGGEAEENTPRRVVNRQRSSIFEDEVVDSRPQSLKTTPGRRPIINPITGAPIENAIPNGKHYSNGATPNGVNGGTPTNGYCNGFSNGHSSPESPMNGGGRQRTPPGGKSSGIF